MKTGSRNSRAMNIMQGLSLACVMALVGCSTTQETLGTVTAFSQQTSGTTGPYNQLETGILSGQIGEGLDANARQVALETEYAALERGITGASVKWTTKGAASGEVIPEQPYRVGERDCRRYTHRITLKGKERSDTGTACRTGDGVWTPLA